MKCRVANKIRNAAAAANDTLAAKTEPAAIGLVVAIFLVRVDPCLLIWRIAFVKRELLSVFQHGKYVSSRILNHRELLQF